MRRSAAIVGSTASGKSALALAAAKTLGYGAFGLNSFNVETVSSDFRGTLYSKTLDSSVPAD